MRGEIPEKVREALDCVWDGASADSVESAWLDFKEDPIHNERQKNPDAQAYEIIVDASLCFANGEEPECYIVFGVNDKKGGPESFSGTERSAEALADRAFNRTAPNLRVEAWPVDYRGCRLVLIRVPRGLAVYTRKNGSASYRSDKSCMPLQGEYRRALEYKRLNPDHTAMASSVSSEDLDSVALERGRNLLENRLQSRGDIAAIPSGPEGLLNALDLFTDDGRITIAGEILFAPPRGYRPLVRYHYRRTPAGEPQTVVFDEPLVLVAGLLQQRIKERTDEELVRVDLHLGQEVPIPLLPSQAVDEAVTNALVHRDWVLLEPIVIDQSALMLKVSSPGSLPPQVRADRLLSTPSRPRNQRLMHAMNRLGLAEQASRGFDRMWLSMLSSGREIPDVEADDYHVDVTFYAGEPDKRFIRTLAAVREEYGADFARDVNVVIVLKNLMVHSTFTLKKASVEMQTSERDTRQNMEFMVRRGFVRSLDDGVWALNEEARELLESSQAMAPIPVKEWVEAHLVGGVSLTNREIVAATGSTSSEVTVVLRQLKAAGTIEKDAAGPSRGAGVRWMRVSTP